MTDKSDDIGRQLRRFQKGDYYSLGDSADAAKPRRSIIKGFVSALFSFRGRLNRSEYFISLCFCLLTASVSGVEMPTQEMSEQKIIWWLVCFPVLVWVGYAVTAKRFHDFGLSGWFATTQIIPIIGWIVTVALFFIRGDADENAFGPPRPSWFRDPV